MTEYFIERTGEPPLKFSGELLGEGTTKTDNSPRWTDVRIFRTAGGKFVVEVTRTTCTPSAHSSYTGEEKTYTDAEVFATAVDVISYLRQNNDDRKLGSASQEALRGSAAANKDFKTAYVEIVE